MKKQNKQKGFTLVELVIVIAVIAILAGVLIPTFSGIVEKANKSAVQQEAANLYKEALALDLSDGKQDGKDGTADVNLTMQSGKEHEYSVTESEEENAITISFKYYNGKYTAEFDGSDWKIKDGKTISTGSGSNETSEKK